MSRAALAAFLVTWLTLAGAAEAKAPPRLSADRSRADIASGYGSGAFGNWAVDRFGLPFYRYTLDEDHDPRAAQPELNGRTDAWHQIGNDHAIAFGFNHGYVELWSQDRRYQWANLYQADRDHFAGGYGYLRVDGHTYSTLHDDGGASRRDFGVGYYRKLTQAGGIDAEENVYAPFGDDPLLLHDVTLTNSTATQKQVSWFEYWDVNPVQQSTKAAIATAPPAWDGARRTLSAQQLPDAEDHDPLTLFSAALAGPVDGHATSTAAFFGQGGRAAPDAVTADHLNDTPPGLSGSSLFAFRAPVTLAPGQSVTLRYAYGAAHANAIPGLVDKYRAAADPLAASETAWSKWLPQVTLGAGRPWLSRELQWDAYNLRSGTSYEDCQGRHIISQGGYYQYDTSFQGAFRDPLQHMLPLIWSDPDIARDVLVYSAQEQPSAGGQIPYAMVENCKRFDLGSSDDLDLWLLWGAAEYGLGTRDMSLFDRPVRYSDGSAGTLWDHLKLAYRHQESQIGPHGDYVTGGTGDWSDFATEMLQMTESGLVTSQVAYVYPRLAVLADARGDHAFAADLRRSGRRALDVVRSHWTGRGWYARGWSGDRMLGQGAIFGEPQPWAVLAGAPKANQARTLVANIRRFLTGVGAPPELHGPTKIGSSLSPARNDPDVTERSDPAVGVGTNNAVWVGGVWFAINGPLAWSLAELKGVVPKATQYAFDEYLRNTLATHATVYPGHWDGIVSVDDACRSFYSANPEQCGNGLSSAWEGNIMHQPAWALFVTLRLAGVEPTAAGYTIDPHLPFSRFDLRLPDVGVAYERRRVRGYVTPRAGGRLLMRVAVPRSWRRVAAYASGHRVRLARAGSFVTFRLPSAAGRPADWAVTRR